MVLQILYLSKNLLTDLQGLQQFTSVQTLSLADNLLSDYDLLEPLQSIRSSLKSLSLEIHLLNPC